MRQGETDEWEREMHLNETATESAWNANEPRDVWEQASWDEAGSWEVRRKLFEDEEKSFQYGRYSTKRSACLREKREKNGCTSESNHT